VIKSFALTGWQDAVDIAKLMDGLRHAHNKRVAQRCEMESHHKLSEPIGFAEYFCDPQSLWQRASNENTIVFGQYLPKGKSLSRYNLERIEFNADENNVRPRKDLGVRSPLAVCRALLFNHKQH